MKLSIDRKHYERAEKLLVWNTLKDVLNGKVIPNWIGESECFWYQRDINTDSKQFIVVDPIRRLKKEAFDHEKLAKALSHSIGKPFTSYDLPFDSFSYLKNEHSIQFSIEETSWLCNLQQYECKMLETNKKIFPHEICSPDGDWTVFTKDHNLYLRNLNTKEVKTLTIDGEPYYDYGSQPEASTSAIFERLYQQQPPPVALWSPNSKKIVSHRLDQRKVRTLHLLQYVPQNQAGEPEAHAYRYPLVGDKYVPLIEFYIFDIEKGSAIQVDFDPIISGMVSPLTEYSQTAFWTEDSNSFYFLNFSRDYRVVQFILVDSETGKARILLEEQSDSFIFTDLYNLGFGGVNIRWINKSNDFIWHSERDGWSHLYLYDGNTGQLKNRITSGEWGVRQIISVDEEKEWLYFTAGGRESDRDPYLQHLYRVRFDGTELMLLTPEDAEHDVFISPNNNYFVDTYSRVDLPPQTILRKTDGSFVCNLEKANVERLMEKGYSIPKRFKVKAADGVTDLYGILIQPANLTKNKKYPVLDSFYGGPQLTHTPKKFTWGGEFIEGPVDFTGGAQAFAQLGFAVLIMDGRGTPYRSKSFHDYSNGNLERAAGLEDHVAALKQLTQRFPFLDKNSVGIYGESGGGYGAARAILSYPETYKVAVAGCGNHDQRYYLAFWGERFQGMYDPELYKEQDNTLLVSHLKGKLLLVTGDMDDNVHPSLTIRMVHALTKANKDFDLMILPNRHHGIGADVYYIRRRWDYFVQHLLKVEPPKEYSIKDPMYPG
ncbi:S9 family peptidase [Lysinibacillus pakistanensis]|uniref:DPP IV N-terminal domain-containing protein n=1 Tax=Lysinibacillus pakistanensis TaxID=759811 RepID=A0AAX3WNN2_9BACI|nr:DPP IV N-terminal domain-containing protein [Lysinibacillus pakistanensis]MDM5233819.1 DPP IV N-terminal domain-containing protein [Lysinibacillus pakistanensis]WHY44436.1 DPP IV N-terminal domain-containing protein [Lysinibacillus pakistanensis]WHY49445.1 DPP IV N-terminal domain-containing protein [Lysinibacillus pakistanensis]